MVATQAHDPLVLALRDAAEQAVGAAQRGTPVDGVDGEFPRERWDTFQQTLADALGGGWLLGFIPPPREAFSYSALHNATLTSVSISIDLDERGGASIYRCVGASRP